MSKCAALAEHAGVEALVAAGAGPEPAGASAEGPETAELVVLRALLRVGERLVSLADFLELLLGALVARVLSGWYSRASLRKAFFISSCEASLGTPSVW